MPSYEQPGAKEMKSKSHKEIMNGKLQVNDMEISDEFVLAEKETEGKEITQLLLDNKGDALLIKDGAKVVGLVTEHSILRAIAQGKIKLELNAAELMDSDILEVKEDDALEDVLPAMYEKQPKAVVVIDSKGNFVGYFSPKDCKLASIRVNFVEE